MNLNYIQDVSGLSVWEFESIYVESKHYSHYNTYAYNKSLLKTLQLNLGSFG